MCRRLFDFRNLEDFEEIKCLKKKRVKKEVIFGGKRKEKWAVPSGSIY